jgi:photosystem II stability/assembly factor-like uncharacterized protein
LQHPPLSTGDGVYKSTDGGLTWAHRGLPEAGQIPEMVVDPANPDRLFVAALGQPHGPNEQRGIFRSIDGGRTFVRILYRDADTGGADIALDPNDSHVVYAALWQVRQPPWSGQSLTGPGSGLFKSTDGGDTWQPIVNDLPTFYADGLGRMAIAVAPTNPARIFAVVDARRRGGLYRSDDAAGTWTLVLPAEAGALTDVAVSAGHPDIVHAVGRGAWQSTDGGETFTRWPGAPRARGYHRIWIHPTNPQIALLAGEHGGAVTVTGGETWSATSNQPTGRFYRVSTDSAFPYRVCGGRQGAGSACVASRSDRGRLTPSDRQVIAAQDYGAVAPDPLDPDIVYGGRLVRFDRRTGQAQDVMPPRDRVRRVLETAPLLFSPRNPRALFFGADRLWRTLDAGEEWTALGPDRPPPQVELPSSLGVHGALAEAPAGALQSLAISPVDVAVMWVGSDDGQLHLSRDDGQTWMAVTPPDVRAWARVSGIEASHFDVNTAYVAVDASGIDDRGAYVYRTRDGGRRWTLAAGGLPENTPVHSVREDLQRRGLLFAGTARGVYVSFDDGDRWQSLRLNMPAAPVRDLVVKDEDLIVATEGRGFWVLDDIMPLRQLTPDVASADAYLFRPATAWRARWRPPQEEPPDSGEPSWPSPPEGVTLSYLLGPRAAGDVTLEIVETLTGTVLRRFTSDEPGHELPTEPGLHRVVWDLRVSPPVADTDDGAGAVPGPWILPGTYQVRLTSGAAIQRQAVLVKLDPRVKTSPVDLTAQLRTSRALAEAMRKLVDARRSIRQRLAATGTSAELNAAAAALDAALGPIADAFSSIQAVDARPTPAMEAAAATALHEAAAALALFTQP